MNIDQIKVFMDHIRKHAVQYFPDLVEEQAVVKLMDKQERPAATLYRFQDNAQMISQGLIFSRGRLDVYERAFLQGYFGQKSVPYPAIRLYEILPLLDKWSSVRVAIYRRSGGLRVIGRGMAALSSLYFKRNIQYLLGQLTRAQAGIKFMDSKRSY